MTVGEWLSERQRSEYNGRHRTCSSNNRNSCNTVMVHMSEYKWCHGPKCHKSHTQDRIRGSKGSKVLRTRKVKQYEYHQDSMFKYFCSNGCYNQFANANIERIVAIAPRNTPLETPINDPVKTDRGYYGQWEITERGVDTQTE